MVNRQHVNHLSSSCTAAKQIVFMCMWAIDVSTDSMPLVLDNSRLAVTKQMHAVSKVP